MKSRRYGRYRGAPKWSGTHPHDLLSTVAVMRKREERSILFYVFLDFFFCILIKREKEIQKKEDGEVEEEVDKKKEDE